MLLSDMRQPHPTAQIVLVCLVGVCYSVGMHKRREMRFKGEQDIFEHIIVERNEAGSAVWENPESEFGVVYCRYCGAKLLFWYSQGTEGGTIEDHLQDHHTDVFFELLLTDVLEEIHFSESVVYGIPTYPEYLGQI